MDVFEDKDSTETTGSLAETESPPMSRGDGGGVLPELMNMVTAAATTATAGGGGVVMNSGSVKKKRGRPRKYDADGNLRAPYNSAGFSSSTPKRGRGRPSGSGNCQIFASLGEIFASTAGGDFTPHVVTVYAGEDVAGKILSFVQKGSRGMCVLSANGPVSNVTISQPGSSGKILTYEGRFEILSLTGSFTTSENGGIKSGTGGLSVSQAGPDGRVIGGGVAGLLMAASPIQIVVGNFMPNGYCQKPQKRKYTTEPKTAPVILGSPDPISVLARPSQAAAPPESTPPSGLSKKESANSTATNTAPTLGLNISIMLLCIMF